MPISVKKYKNVRNAQKKLKNYHKAYDFLKMQKIVQLSLIFHESNFCRDKQHIRLNKCKFNKFPAPVIIYVTFNVICHYTRARGLGSSMVNGPIIGYFKLFAKTVYYAYSIYINQIESNFFDTVVIVYKKCNVSGQKRTDNTQRTFRIVGLDTDLDC